MSDSNLNEETRKVQKKQKKKIDEWVEKKLEEYIDVEDGKK